MTERCSSDLNCCQICGKVSISRCINCKKVWYCSRPHQKEDWSRHRSDCFPAVLTTSPIFGRYLSATRDIPEGTLILKEKPLFSAPNGKNGAFLLCLGCYGIVPTDQPPQLCTKCGWPLHKNCVQSKEHVENECAIFSKMGITPSSREENIYDKIVVLRGCLLKLRDVKKWDCVGKLQDHKEDRFRTTDGANLSKTMVEFVQNKCGLSEAFSDIEIDHVLGCVMVNAYVTEDNLTSSPNFHAGSFVYWNGSMPAHDCTPNCRWIIVQGGELRLWSLRDIKEDESLCHCYAWGGTGTIERQRHLLKTKFFSCTCRRCADPTELGSFFSGIKCKIESCSGFILSQNPAQVGSTWACNQCKASAMQELEVDSFIQELREAHFAVTSDCPSPEEMGSGWRTILQRLEEYDESVLNKLAPTHFFIQEVEQDIMLRISYILAQEQEFQIEREERLRLAGILVKLSTKCLSLLEKVAPGLTTHAGRQYYYLQQGQGIFIMDQIRMQNESDSTSSQALQALRKEISHWQGIRKRGARILESESPGREEWVLGRAMVDNDETSSGGL